MNNEEVKIPNKGTYSKSKYLENKYNSFEKKEFAKNFVLSKNPAEAFIKTFPNKNLAHAKSLGVKLLDESFVQEELKTLLPSNQDIAAVMAAAINAPLKEARISWRDKHQYVETALKVGGHLKNDPNQTQINVGVVIEE